MDGEAWKGETGRGGREGGDKEVGMGEGKEGRQCPDCGTMLGVLSSGHRLCRQKLDSQYLSPDRPRNKATDSNGRGLFTQSLSVKSHEYRQIE